MKRVLILLVIATAIVACRPSAKPVVTTDTIKADTTVVVDSLK